MQGRKLKATFRDSAPTILVTVGAESSPAPWGDGKGGAPHIIDRAVVTVQRRTHRGWGRVAEHECPGWGDAWDVIDAVGKAGRRVYVVAGRASDLLVQLHWWERVERGEVSVWDQEGGRRRKGEPKAKGESRRRHPLVMQGRPDIIGYTIHGCSYRWVSVTNWADVSIADAARQVGYPIPVQADEADKWESVKWRAEDQARVINQYMVRLIDWWLLNGCGVWKDTPGAAAWSSFTRRTGAETIIQHADPDAIRLESRACFGGRASTFYFGDIGDPEQWGELASAPDPAGYTFGMPGPVHRLDVRSMYPTIMRDERFPVALLAVQVRTTVADLARRLKSLLCVASVTVRSSRAELPRRERNGVSHPVGEWRVVLSTPELRAALDHGEIVKVHRAAWYTPGTPFAEWASWTLNLRGRMRAAGDVAGEAFVKLLANSLGGRLARRRQGWEACPGAIPRELWGSWHHLDADTGGVVERRVLGGLVQQMERDEHRPATLAACYAHLTAYGRVRMGEVRSVAGKREVLWQDTDGVIVTDLGRKRIERSEHYHPTEPGKLRWEATYHNGRFLTAKHYWLDGKWVLAGIHDGFSVPDGKTAIDVVTTNPARTAVRPDAAGVYRITRHIDLSAIEPGVIVAPSGWALPPSVREDGSAKPQNEGQGELWEE